MPVPAVGRHSGSIRERLNRGLRARSTLFKVAACVVSFQLLLVPRALSWTEGLPRASRQQLSPCDEACGRRQAALLQLSLPASGMLSALAAPGPAEALVKGNSPPADYGVLKGFKRKKSLCLGAVECEEEAEEKAEEKFGRALDMSFNYTPSGIRYKDMVEGQSGDGVAKTGDSLFVKYRVMRSGKRSNDGLSGEASTIFSWGYGEEDDEPPKANLEAVLGSGRFVKALEEGLVGMAVGGKRRVQVRPENDFGWLREKGCGEKLEVGLIVGLPVGGVTQREACLDKSLLPQPASFASERRFARRFDESLIVEVELVDVKPGA